LHPGHFNLLTFCREVAGTNGQVIVGIDTDCKIKKDKGESRPFYREDERMNNLLTLKRSKNGVFVHLIDEVISFTSNEVLSEIVRGLKPNFIVKGSDWKGNVVGSEFAEVIYFNLEGDLSTTSIEQRILGKK
jgi:D-beta-D-heptose 7-phosphate kinase/D-beta-D-heptose 1-phosphate adenosyltransferase